MKPSDFDYELPPERIAQRPAAERDAARLLVHELAADRTRHLRVADLCEVLRAGDLLVLNDTRVLPARLFGRRASGGRVELLLLEPVDRGDAGPGARWKAFVRPARKLAPGELLVLEGGALGARALERPRLAGGAPAQEWIVELVPLGPGGSGLEPVDPAGLVALLERHGHLPLPPYVARPGGGTPEEERLDRERYQTVFARVPGAVAAPTAGLHLTERLLAGLEQAGIGHAFLTLHVGAGTFLPVQAEDLAEHRMHAERFDLPAATAERVAAARRAGGRVVAVGTTSVRTLESRAAPDGTLAPGTGTTELFLRPGARFHVVDALLTNFHLPRSTLLMLVAAFAGRERVLRLYGEALREGYRFYSYGDAMLLLP